MPADDELQFDDLLDPSFQELILALGVRDKPFLARARPILQPRYFSSEVGRQSCRGLIDYWDEYHDLPAVESLVNAVVTKGENRETRNAWAAYIRNLYGMPDDFLDRQFLKDRLAFFAQRAEAAKAVGQAFRTLKTFDITKLTHEIRQIEQIPTWFTDLGYEVRRDWGLALEEDTRKKFLTGFTGIDQPLRGGMREGELICFLASPKAGKSMLLQNLARGFLQAGHNVAYYSFEMRQLDVLKRIVASISNQETNYLHDRISSVEIGMRELENYTNSKLFIKEFPGLHVTLDAVESHYTSVAAECPEDERPVIILDYLALVRSPASSGKTWVDYPMNFVLLRSLGWRQRVPAITVHQTTGAGFKATRLDETYFAGAREIAAHIDAAFGINQSDEDYTVNRFMIEPFLNRHERKDLVSYWKSKFECCRLEEITRDQYEALYTPPTTGDDEDEPDEPPRRRRR